MKKALITSALLSLSCLSVLHAGFIEPQTKVLTKLVAPKTAADVPTFAAGAPLSEAYVQTLGRMAYIWAWPLINMNSRHTMFSQVKESSLLGGILPVAPIGQITMLHDYMEPSQRFVTSPNQDVVYGAGFFSLDKEPTIIQVPDFKGRFWVYQIIDQRTDSFCEVGQQYKTEPGHYLLVGENWKGKVPKGVKGVFRSSTNIAAVFPRVFMDDTKADREAIRPLINQVMAYPLSQYDGKMKTKDWSKIPDLKRKKASGSAETKWVEPSTFPQDLERVLNQVKPLPGEEALYSWMQSLVDASKKNPKLKKALVKAALDTEKEIISDMFEYRNNGVDAGNGWRTQINAAQFGYGYFQRTATAKGNMFSNRGVETVYYGADFDSNKQRISAGKNYTVTFAKGELPPVNGFWSLTLYNEEHFFVPNKLNRFSLGTKNKSLVKNKDGSLTIYVQDKNPGGKKTNNWLPAPHKGNYSLYIRAYWPKSNVLKGEWTPPKIEVSTKKAK